MKNPVKLLLLISCTLAALTTEAQISIGLKGGANWANIQAPDAVDAVTPDFRTLNGFTLGAVASLNLIDKLAFQPELLYTRKGFVLQEGFDADLFNIPVPLGVKAASSFDYLELPLLMKYQFGGDAIKAYVVAGPSFGYAVSGRLKTTADALFDIELTNRKIDLNSIDYQRFEVGAAVGAGFSFSTPLGDLFLDGRYTHGFNQVYDIPLLTDKVKNKGFALSAGFLIPIQ